MNSPVTIVEVDPLLGVSDGEEYNPSPTETFPAMHALLEQLESHGVRTVSQLGLLCGGFAFDAGPAVLFVLRHPDDELAARMSGLGGGALAGFLWAVASERARPAWSHLLGAGVVCASAGASGRPLVGLGVGELRQELAESRNCLHSVLGYAPSVCCPTPNEDGVAVDGLVEREARRAGFELILEPGLGREASENKRVSVYSPSQATSTRALGNWIRGEPWVTLRFAWKHRRQRWFA